MSVAFAILIFSDDFWECPCPLLDGELELELSNEFICLGPELTGCICENGAGEDGGDWRIEVH